MQHTSHHTPSEVFHVFSYLCGSEPGHSGPAAAHALTQWASTWRERDGSCAQKGVTTPWSVSSCCTLHSAAAVVSRHYSLMHGHTHTHTQSLPLTLTHPHTHTSTISLFGKEYFYPTNHRRKRKIYLWMDPVTQFLYRIRIEECFILVTTLQN